MSLLIKNDHKFCPAANFYRWRLRHAHIRALGRLHSIALAIIPPYPRGQDFFNNYATYHISNFSVVQIQIFPSQMSQQQLKACFKHFPSNDRKYKHRPMKTNLLLVKLKHSSLYNLECIQWAIKCIIYTVGHRMHFVH